MAELGCGEAVAGSIGRDTGIDIHNDVALFSLSRCNNNGVGISRTGEGVVLFGSAADSDVIRSESENILREGEAEGDITVSDACGV